MSRRSEISAGILAYRRKPRFEILLAHPGGPYWQNKDDGAWSIPKGNVESDDLLACAKREFNEETGLLAKGPFDELTPLKQKSGKVVHAFAIEADFDLSIFSSNEFEMEWPPRSGRMQSFAEVDEAQWFTMEEARRMVLESQRPMLDALDARTAE